MKMYTALSDETRKQVKQTILLSKGPGGLPLIPPHFLGAFNSRSCLPTVRAVFRQSGQMCECYIIIHRGQNLLIRLPHTLSQTFILMSTTHTLKPVFVIAPHLSPYWHYTRKFLKSLMSSSSSETSQTSTQYSSTPTHHSQLDLTDVEDLLGQSVTAPQVRF
jgi:hypothetical protein